MGFLVIMLILAQEVEISSLTLKNCKQDGQVALDHTPESYLGIYWKPDMPHGDIFSRYQIHLSYIYRRSQVTGHAPFLAVMFFVMFFSPIKFVLAILVEGHSVTISAKLFLILISCF